MFACMKNLLLVSGDMCLLMLITSMGFAAAGQQLFGGILKNRCLNIQTGAVHPDDIFCS